jgi:CheY-like chemotaxis protein
MNSKLPEGGKENTRMPSLNTTPNASILVVDDYESTLQATSELLQSAGFYVRTARNGLDALNTLASDDSISLVLLDLCIPVMDGWEFLRRKNSDPGLAELPVVVISAIPPADLDGVETVLPKPIDFEQLIETVRHFVELNACRVAVRSESHLQWKRR